MDLLTTSLSFHPRVLYQDEVQIKENRKNMEIKGQELYFSYLLIRDSGEYKCVVGILSSFSISLYPFVFILSKNEKKKKEKKKGKVIRSLVNASCNNFFHSIWTVIDSLGFRVQPLFLS